MTALDLAGIRARAAEATDDVGLQYSIPAAEWLIACDKPTAQMLMKARADMTALLAEVERLTRLLGSHADGHLCTCEMIDSGQPGISPPEWEQDPWCPTHPDMTQVLAEVESLRAQVADQRSTEAVLRGEIRRNVSALETFDAVMDERDELRAQVAEAGASAVQSIAEDVRYQVRQFKISDDPGYFDAHMEIAKHCEDRAAEMRGQS